MEKRLLLAAVLSLAILAAWELLLPKPRKAPQAAPTTVPTAPAEAFATPTAPSPAAAEAPVGKLPPPVSGRAEEKAVIENGLVRATFSSRGGVLSSLVLLR